VSSPETLNPLWNSGAEIVTAETLTSARRAYCDSNPKDLIESSIYPRTRLCPMIHRRLASVAQSREITLPVPLMAYEHIKQCFQVAHGRIRAEAAIRSAEERYERDRRRALAFVKAAKL